MVYYMTDGARGLQRPPVPPVCPKCGSHRTQIIGTFGGSNTLNIRCGSCGEVSTVEAPNVEDQNSSSGAESAEYCDEELQEAIGVAIPR